MVQRRPKHIEHAPVRVQTGIISTTRKGAGYIDDPDPKKDSIYVEEGTLNTALNGDTVEYTVSQRSIRGKKTNVAKIIRVKNKVKDSFVGVVTMEGGSTVLVPDDKKMYVNIRIVSEEVGSLKQDDKAFVKLLPWTDSTQLPTGRLLKMLGPKGKNDVEMESIVLDKGFEIGFPAPVENEAHEIERTGKNTPQEEIKTRRDMRNTLTFTIDPHDAKDFDDAISFKKVQGEAGELYEIGVHIADVSHYVREGSALDKEAQKRGCSIYLVDRTIPMLPEVLSNDVCSLNPHEDKLTFSAIFVMDAKARIQSRWFGKTIINSDHRFTYENAEESIQKESGPYHEELTILNNIAKVLKEEKFSDGAIEFEQDEVKFRLDAEGKPIGVYVSERTDSHKLVEEYMLLANREVAKYISDSIKKKGTRDTGSIYRIHDAPDVDKVKDLALFVKALGFELRTDKDGHVTAAAINHLLEQIEDTPHASLIRTASIRSMQKAIYSTINIGHFGLAFSFYTHFTSPIRRYPDLLVHRILHKHIENRPFGDKDIVTFQKIAENSTMREIDAAEAERSSKKLKQVEYMSTRIGQVFEGVISGVSNYGMYVQENESRSEGMISIRSIGDDYYVFNEKTYSISGQKSNKKFTLGDPIRFRVIAADFDRKTLDYELVRE
ncbi:MAG: ribonuclease R [Candidatus Paceibacterota bacterium]